VSSGERSPRRPGDGVLAIANFFCYKSSKIEMSTIAEIQEAIEKLPANEKSALAAWLQSQKNRSSPKPKSRSCSHA
jgi:hypothetical protein